jgi:hypothetical protein
LRARFAVVAILRDDRISTGNVLKRDSPRRKWPFLGPVGFVRICGKQIYINGLSRNVRGDEDQRQQT